MGAAILLCVFIVLMSANPVAAWLMAGAILLYVLLSDDDAGKELDRRKPRD